MIDSARKLGEIVASPQFTPVWVNGQLGSGEADWGLKLGAEKGIQMLSDLYPEGDCLSFCVSEYQTFVQIFAFKKLHNIKV